MRRYLAEAKPLEFDTEPAALDALKKGDADAYFGDALRASFWLNDNVGCCDFAGEPYFRPDLFGDGLSIAVPAGHDAVRQALDYGLGRLKRSGVYDELYLRWFPVSFYSALRIRARAEASMAAVTNDRISSGFAISAVCANTAPGPISASSARAFSRL